MPRAMTTMTQSSKGNHYGAFQRKPLAAASVPRSWRPVAPLATAAVNPFSAQQLSGGYDPPNFDKDAKAKAVKAGAEKKPPTKAMRAGDKAKEGSCGDKAKEGSCGDKAKEGSCGDKAKEGSCGDKKAAEGKCGGS